MVISMCAWLVAAAGFGCNHRI